MVYDKVDAPEVVGCLDDIIHPDGLIRNPDGVGFKYIARLLLCQTAALHMI